MKSSLSVLLVIILLAGVVFSFVLIRKLSHGLQIIRNIYYAGVEDKYRALDIYSPSCKGKHPVIFFVHGGAWTIGDKKDHTAKGLFFAKQGYVFVSVNYRLAPEVSYPDFAYDVAEALSWVYDHVGDYCGDQNRIYLMGHSAGAHLVALVSYEEKFLSKYGLDTSIVKGLILLDGGGYDLVHIHDSFPVLYKTLFKRAFGEDKNVLRDASPIAHVEEGSYMPPTLVIYTDWRLTKADSQRLINALNEVGAPFEVFYAQGKTHDAVSKDIGKPGDAVTAEILKFLESIGGG